ncbi:hypothetical protein OD91_0864 [Lutibacter sp. Hel_I_33_5]|uniref:hypothetical protein n=1 Tax=Lutibacter sp. Hel_I_33_5 TaxID=1566289 RepID=UPI0011AC1AF1|nr:hypothetical protein [Lutibacter sp. Hel_I_33_5]TVZ55609.1 hypothetical protein OD91_0864 [Lutibacter sp. Hel_I_33_5]
MDLAKRKEALVIHYFLTEQNNTQVRISELTGVKESRINTILNKYLKSKTIQ